jgi:hypothetical protein
MKSNVFFIILLCLGFYTQSQGQSGAQPSPLSGAWQLESVYVSDRQDTSPVRLQGDLPAAIYYSCPAKIEVKNASGCSLYFGNGETKEVFQYVYTYQNESHLLFSFEGQTSTPERQYNYIMETSGQSLRITLSDDGNEPAASTASYIYYYSPVK